MSGFARFLSSKGGLALIGLIALLVCYYTGVIYVVIDELGTVATNVLAALVSALAMPLVGFGLLMMFPPFRAAMKGLTGLFKGSKGKSHK
jgi:hypothetical protein